MSRYDELLAQKAAIEAELERLHETARTDAIEHIKQLVSKFSITDVEVFGRPVRSVRAVVQDPDALKPKYRNPDTGETWAGRGRRPVWMSLRPEHELLIDAPTQNAPTIGEKLQTIGDAPLVIAAPMPEIDNPFPIPK